MLECGDCGFKDRRGGGVGIVGGFSFEIRAMDLRRVKGLAKAVEFGGEGAGGVGEGYAAEAASRCGD